MKHTDLKELVEYSTTAPVKKDILSTEWFNVVLVCLEEGQEIQPHPEPYSVLFQVIDGEGTITVGTEKYDVKPNHIIFVPKNGIRGIRPHTHMSLLGIRQPH
ncbi:MAG: cupin domain-containing protein [Methanosarcinales archaeon]|nr:cupin domain-containing protein [Methanosarcinales archaeon]